MGASHKIQSRRSPLVPNLSGALIGVLIVLNVLLLRDDLTLRREIASLASQSIEALVGQQVEGFTAISARDAQVRLTIDYADDQRKKVFVFLSASCPFSRAQVPRWRELLGKLDAQRFEMIGLVSEGEDIGALAEYLGDTGMESFTVGVVSTEILRAYRLSGTPTTLVVGPGGVVEKAWSGRWGPRAVADAADYFGVPLARDREGPTS